MNTRWEATQMVMVAKLTRLAHKIAVQLHLVTESCTICSCLSRRPVRKLLDTFSYVIFYSCLCRRDRYLACFVVYVLEIFIQTSCAITSMGDQIITTLLHTRIKTDMSIIYRYQTKIFLNLVVWIGLWVSVRFSKVVVCNLSSYRHMSFAKALKSRWRITMEFYLRYILMLLFKFDYFVTFICYTIPAHTCSQKLKDK
jgi:hypothetical protein